MGAPGGSDGHVAGRPWLAAATQIVVDDPDDPAGPLLDEAARHHLGRVLRLRPGEVVCTTDGAGSWRLTTWTGGERLEPDGAHGVEPAPSPAVSVGFVPVKGDRPELVVQKLTELGVDRIVVTSSSRSVVRWDGDRATRHLDRLRRVSLEATQQCRRLWLPTIEVGDLRSLVEGGTVLADVGGDEPTPDVQRVVVGPEGGWTDEERSFATSAPVTLGDHVLRAETAAIAAGVLLTSLRRISAPRGGSTRS